LGSMLLLHAARTAIACARCRVMLYHVTLLCSAKRVEKEQVGYETQLPYMLNEQWGSCYVDSLTGWAAKVCRRGRSTARGEIPLNVPSRHHRHHHQAKYLEWPK